MEFDQEIYEMSRLIVREKTGKITPDEKALLDEWCRRSDRNARLYKKYNNPDFFREKIIAKDSRIARLAFQCFSARTEQLRRRRIFRRIAVCAVAILLPVLSLPFLLQDYSSKPEILVQNMVIQPGSAKAVLILGSGQEVELAGSERNIMEDETSISVNGARISYKNKGKYTETPTMNVIRIPRGGEYRLSLSDSTQVWLNSETEIHFPVYFSGNTREVYVKGEAYFEVTPDVEHPFIVRTEMAAVEVLGTSFNVRQYDNEAKMLATLVEGKIRLSNDTDFAVLNPGQQAEVCTDEALIEVSEVDVTKYTAWKEGRFAFSNQSLGEIMNMLARWYDIQVYFDSEATRQITLTGDLKRYENFANIIRMLEITNKVKCEISGNSVLIKKAPSMGEE